MRWKGWNRKDWFWWTLAKVLSLALFIYLIYLAAPYIIMLLNQMK